MSFVYELNANTLPQEGSSDDAPEVHVPLDVYKEALVPWKRALFLKLLGKSISMKVLKSRVESLWNLQWGCELVDLEGGFFVVSFQSSDDYRYVLENGLCIILGHYLTVSKWRPFFDPLAADIPSTRIWIRFPNVPIECLNQNILLALGNSVEKAIRVDTTSKEAICGRYARVCVELQLDKPLTPILTLYGQQFMVEYEGLHQIKRGKYGHRVEGCSWEPNPKDGPTGGQPEISL